MTLLYLCDLSITPSPCCLNPDINRMISQERENNSQAPQLHYRENCTIT